MTSPNEREKKHATFRSFSARPPFCPSLPSAACSKGRGPIVGKGSALARVPVDRRLVAASRGGRVGILRGAAQGTGHNREAA